MFGRISNAVGRARCDAAAREATAILRRARAANGAARRRLAARRRWTAWSLRHVAETLARRARRQIELDVQRGRGR